MTDRGKMSIPQEPEGEGVAWYRGWEAGWDQALDYWSGEGYRAYKGGCDLGAPIVTASSWGALMDAIDEEEDEA